HEGVADRGQLPVEDPDDAGRVAGVEDEVVQPEVVVDQRVRVVCGDPLDQPGHGLLEVRYVRGAGGPEALDPLVHLALGEAVAAVQPRQLGDGRDVDVVQLDKHDVD